MADDGLLELGRYERCVAEETCVVAGQPTSVLVEQYWSLTRRGGKAHPAAVRKALAARTSDRVLRIVTWSSRRRCSDTYVHGGAEYASLGDLERARLTAAAPF